MSQRSAKARMLHATMLSMFAILGAVALAACGSSSGGSSASNAGGSSASSTAGGGAGKGAPIKVMSLAPIISQTGAFPAVKYAAEAYQKWVNANGGIGGRPLSLTFCDTQGTAAKEASCAQQAVSDKDVAVVGGFLLDPSALVQVLKSAGIAWLGSPGVDSTEYTNSNVFPIGGQYAYQAGGAVLAYQSGCRKLAVVLPDVPAIAQAIQVIQNGYKSAGGNPSAIKIVKYAPTTTDYSTTAGEAASGTDCIYTFLPGPVFPAWLSALKSVGATQKLVVYQGEIFASVAKQFSSQLNGTVAAGAYADFHTSPDWATYRQALASVNAPSSLDYAGPQGQNTWAAFVTFTNIAKGISDLNAGSFLSAANKAASVDTGGLLRPLDFTKTFSGLGGKIPRDFNQNTIFFKIKNGVSVAQGGFKNMTSAINGQ